MKRFFDRFGFWISLIICIVIYLALAYKNPFKDNNLISNLEPYPDTLLYSFPAWNWVRGNGWNLGVGEKIVDITVPNTYGIMLVPLMWIFKDIRSFYFTNLIFGIGTLLFFMLALKNFFGNKKWCLISFFGFLLATNFYFFNQPQLVMAENVNYLLVSIFLYLLSLKFNWKCLIQMLILSGFTLMVKQTNLVLGGSFVLSFLIKILIEKRKNIDFKKVFLAVLCLVLLVSYFYLPKMLEQLGIGAFNLGFFKTNFSFYFNCLKSGQCRNLWYSQKLVTWDVSLMFILGVVVMLVSKKERFLSISLFLPIVLLTLAMSVFRDTEGRHVEILVPIMLVFGCFVLDKISSKFKFPFLLVIALFGINLFLTGYQTNNTENKIVSLKKQVGLNFRHREDPWNYICFTIIDDFMKDKSNAYFGSFLPIFFLNAYNSKINYLPLASNQDFMERGLSKYFSVPLKGIYKEKLKEDKEIYLSDYYANNGREAWRKDWDEIVSLGKLEKVYQSPLDNCNIYKISIQSK